MVGVDQDPELIEVARAIALDAEAISPSPCTMDEEPAFAALDTQLLAYSIGRDRVRTGAVSYDFPILMQAIEHVIAREKSASL
ncbi:hypothetical protein SAMN04488056_101117 [Cohaesibacter marisflavi]|uniref:Uncharacterized protein n=2 Tax=Cohaesibacter marisflavi TaxID=655353 RepID=A0A1I4ZJP3_9HYPH|nr:hypothetical protein [Cohaesibacter marisflavi]SFN50462.1 hypothetical protein SAMN04488056_101117 [Cohaesibacter marisflavi]